uniref:Uncharacterized protein n=1 Tax=Oryza sativa subsp. japonica TaxID=39947 RepID=Q69KI7_ORYSJ|nr:hypothetical protein [Oryza sativa Japonica Group]BAD36553.1 hypothetical protein [Oryza sativa Japonica Group]
MGLPVDGGGETCLSSTMLSQASLRLGFRKGKRGQRSSDSVRARRGGTREGAVGRVRGGRREEEEAAAVEKQHEDLDVKEVSSRIKNIFRQSEELTAQNVYCKYRTVHE